MAIEPHFGRLAETVRVRDRCNAMQTNFISTDRFVRHGSLDVPSDAEAQYEAAKAYLGADPGERRLFSRLEHARDGRRYALAINHRNNDYFDPSTNTIGWDPYSALRTTGGQRQSPALGLGHEIDHAVEGRMRAARLMRAYDRAFDNKEERRVILGSETRAARTLGEGVRTNHRGTTYRVGGPTQR
ncbi:MAG TPA: hypothetical protein VFN49_04955 [Candidatus Aquilonibacter sp.]|nr:hypothetical protein [Candidatus Aquilonibacter sp.]